MAIRTAVLAFVRTYGLLGYAALAAAVGRGAPSDAAGDPLGWIWAHAETVALCLHLTYGLQAGDDAALQHRLRAVQLPQPPQTVSGPQLMLPAVWDQPRVPFHWASPLHSPEDWRTYARAIRRDVLNAHLHGIHPQLRRARGQGAGRLPLSGPPCRGLLASAPRQPPWRRAAVCRAVVSGLLCPDPPDAAVLSRGGAGAGQPLRPPRAAAGRPRGTDAARWARGVTRPPRGGRPGPGVSRVHGSCPPARHGQGPHRSAERCRAPDPVRRPP